MHRLTLHVVDDLVVTLGQLPPELDLVADVVYDCSQTLDGRQLAVEYLRRRKLAEKGIVEPAANGSISGAGADAKNGAGGWSEVAKKGPAPKEDNSSAFKVVAAKKKGKR